MSSPAKPQLDFIGITIALVTLAALVGCWLATWQLGVLLASGVMIAIVIWQACDPFAEAAQWIGTTLRIPGSVRGATLDAIASSMPELFSGIFFVVVAVSSVDAGEAAAVGAEGYGSTIATCAGSAVYNMILIPAAVGLVVSFRRKSQPYVEVGNEVLARDGIWFLVCEMLLILFLYEPQMNWWHALIFLSLYLVYVAQLARDTWRHRQNLDAAELAEELAEEQEETPQLASCLFGTVQLRMNHVTAWSVVAVSTLVAAIACYFLVDLTRATAEHLQVPTFFVAVILAAAVSSVPDTFLSIGAAMRGDDSGAISNAFGSNIFDICVCLSIPLLVNSYLVGWQPVLLSSDGEPIPGLVGLRLLLWVLTAVTLLVLWYRRQLGRGKALLLLLLYLIFVGYAVVGSLWH